MKVVIDTNVLVSGLMKQGTPPAEVVADLLSGRLVALYDDRIIAEYAEVLARPKLKIAADKAEALIEFITGDGERVSDARFPTRLPDEDDQPFADVAFSGGANLLITGNGADFPVGRAIRVVTPRQWVEIKGKMELARRLGEDEQVALEFPESFTVAVACMKCRKVRLEELLGLTPLIEPQRSPGTCIEPDANQPDGRCGGAIWTYDDNDLGRRRARALGIPVVE